ncbi:hypothetical protein Mal15_07650 [Stieleria maiorica]|uniref:Uncharacterized protein n=1 Tax=Stieleria maiorica TaxID=2795974 RepID=A0A5B9M964_9BACT|nr:hypothetical protein Mal15_07650 [Stieleria maiorica]
MLVNDQSPCCLSEQFPTEAVRRRATNLFAELRRKPV